MVDDDEQIPLEVKEAFTRVVLRVEKRRKINLLAMLIALVVMLVGLPLGLAYMGNGRPGEFRGWILLVPLSTVGLVLWLFGKWARKV